MNHGTSTGEMPHIHMIDTEADALAALAIGAGARSPEVSALLLTEIDRAIIHDRDHLPAGTVVMNSQVEFVDEAAGTARTVELVYPAQADIAQGRISILTPVGAGLIGLRTGQSILWPDRDGHERRLTIVAVDPTPTQRDPRYAMPDACP